MADERVRAFPEHLIGEIDGTEQIGIDRSDFIRAKRSSYDTLKAWLQSQFVNFETKIDANYDAGVPISYTASVINGGAAPYTYLWESAQGSLFPWEPLHSIPSFVDNTTQTVILSDSPPYAGLVRCTVTDNSGNKSVAYYMVVSPFVS